MKADISQYRQVPFKKRTSCRICDAALPEPLISLPAFPLTEFYTREAPTEKLGFADQHFSICPSCGQGQLHNIVDPEFLYGASYVTRTTTSPSASAAVNVFLAFIEKQLRGRQLKTVVEIGCNDLYTLKKLEPRSEKLIGIDPVLKQMELEPGAKIELVADFIDNVDLKGLAPDIVVASHTLEHIENPRDVILRLIDAAKDDTLLFFQFPGFEYLVEEAHFDQLYHQHLNYFSVPSVRWMLSECGAELVDYEFNPDHWGALMICFRRRRQTSLPAPKESKIFPERVLSQYELFKRSMRLASDQIAALPTDRVFAWGAAQMLPVLAYYIEEFPRLELVADDDVNKQGMYYLNAPIRVTAPSGLPNPKECTFVITAVNSKQPLRAITARLIQLGVRGVIIPLTQF